MKTILVMYYSKYGSTKQYATWLSERLDADLVAVSKIKAEDLKQYDTIIYGGGLYAGGLKGIKRLSENFNHLQGKKIVVFTCGLADVQNEVNVKGIRANLDKIFTKDMQEHIAFFHVRGAINYKKLTPLHKVMMSMLKRMLSKQDPNTLTDENKEMLQTYGQGVDFTDKSSLDDIIDYVNTTRA